jgi:hypothetical protein
MIPKQDTSCAETISSKARCSVISRRSNGFRPEIFGWFKTVALMRKTRYRGLEWVGWIFTWAAAVFNLVRMRNLLGVTT